jgi:hypothetical protein
LLRGRKAEVGSVGRVPAADIERAIVEALKAHEQQGTCALSLVGAVERVVVAHDHLLI